MKPNWVKTVDKLDLLARLPDHLFPLTNAELARRLAVRSKKSIQMGSWFDHLRMTVERLQNPYWLKVKRAEYDEVFAILARLAGRRIPEQALMQELVGSFVQHGADKMTTRKMLRWISTPEMLKALVEDEDEAERLIDKYDWELMRMRRR